MPTVKEIHRAIESVAPERFAFGFDRVGLQVGDPEASVERGIVTLDHSIGAIDFAIDLGAGVIVAHHPLLFEPARSVTPTDHVGRAILKLVENRIALIAAHTNWDSARGGINDRLARDLGLVEVEPFGSGSSVERVKIQVFAPRERVHAIVDAASSAGAGVIGNYDQCSFQSEGYGTFRGNEHANPSVGQVGRFERVAETKVEMICRADQMRSVERAVRAVHPYEEPALDFLMCTPIVEQPAGRIGRLPMPLPLRQWVSEVDQRLATRCLTWGDPDAQIERVALVGGAADSEWQSALAAGADAFLTGEVRQHIAVEASDTTMALVAAGHYATEHPGCVELAERLRAALPAVEWQVYEPQAGRNGRPLN